jgi:tRNA pseudouridine38-40 synthase
MPTVKLIVEYDGARYHGWQRQPDRTTIQGVLEEKIGRIAGKEISVTGAGRTDAGVHALGQVAHFVTEARLRPEAWARALNSLLPEDIVVLKAEAVLDRFHARHRAKARVYRYHILNRRYPAPIGRQYRWVVYPALNLGRMRSAARYLKGRHDFSAFCAGSPSKGNRSSVCAVRRLAVSRTREEIVFELEADRFLHQMVRTIVGTLVDVGRGKRRPEEIREILTSKDRRRAGPTAPAQGLFLVSVRY